MMASSRESLLGSLLRRRLLGGATGAALMLGLRSPSRAQDVPLTGLSRFAPVRQITAGDLDVGYVDLGPETGPAVVLLHGWPYDIHSYAEVAPSLARLGYRVIVPHLRGFGSTVFRSPQAPRNGQQSVLAVDVINLMDALGIARAIIAGFDWGARAADIVAALWPERCRALVSVSGYLVINLEANQKPLAPQAELGWWYQYYFATERGRAGYQANRKAFARLIWQLASPKWAFDDATFERSAAALENPDHVAVVIHNYRWRLGLADGEARYDHLEEELQRLPVIGVPTITIGSDFDGPGADGASYSKKFSGRHDHRLLPGIGHNVPQEAPQPFLRAILDADLAAGRS